MESSLAQVLGNRIRDARLARGLSQEALAHKCGFHRTYIGMIERAEKNLSVQALAKLASGLNTTMAELLEGL